MNKQSGCKSLIKIGRNFTQNGQIVYLMSVSLSAVLSSYRNQSIDFHSKSIDWFLYEGNAGT